MITYSDIDDIIDNLTQALSITFYRADQRFMKPVRPYATYRILSDRPESLHQNHISSIEKDHDNATLKYREGSKATISLDFIGDRVAHMEILRTKASEAFNWFRFNRVKDRTIRLLNPNVQDRNAFIDPRWEYKIGFDIRVDYTEIHSKDIESINTVEMTPTVNDEVKDDLIVSIP